MQSSVANGATAPAHSAWTPASFVYGNSAAMRAVERVIANLAAADVPVLIVGESGTGKRTAAYQIHQRSAANQRPFVNVACSTLGADFFSNPHNGNGHNGETLHAHNFLARGTILLEEIADLDGSLQPRLLHAILGAEREGQAGRLICCSRKNLEQEVRNGRFREDLYYRLNGVCLRMPPLRHRKEDIPELTQFFLRKYAAQFQRPEPVLSADGMALLVEHSWPGNVRELENTARALVAMGEEEMALSALRRPARRAHRAVEGVSLKEASRAASRQAERELILKALSKTRWNRKRAAQELQISYKALLYKLKQIGLDDYATS